MDRERQRYDQIDGGGERKEWDVHIQIERYKEEGKETGRHTERGTD